MPLYHKTIGQGPDLVLLHGWGFNSDIWLPMATPLSEQYTVHCYDLPGFGRSRHVALAPDLNELIEVLLPLLPQNASYVGWSLGGLLAMAIAASFPLRVKSLVTIGSSPCFLQNENWNGVSPDFFNSFYSLMLQDAQKGLKQFALLMLATRKDQRQFSSSVLQMMHHDDATDTPTGKKSRRGHQTCTCHDRKTIRQGFHHAARQERAGGGD